MNPKNIEKLGVYCIVDEKSSKKSLVMATGVTKMSTDSQGKPVEMFEAIPIASAYLTPFDGLNLQLNSGEKKFYLKHYISYECGTKTNKERLAENLYELINSEEDREYPVGSIVYFVNDADEIRVMTIEKYKYNNNLNTMEMYIINPLDSYDFWALEEKVWKDRSRLSITLDNLLKTVQ